MVKDKGKLSKGQIRSIIVASISIVLAVALIITNFFVPVKYLGAYMVIRNGGAAEGVMRVRFLDVGYGDCAVIELPDGKNMLIDAGNGTGSNVSRILKNLNKCDIGTIDYLFCSTVNPENCGGLAEIIRYRTVDKIYMPYCENTYITDEYHSFVEAARNSGAKLLISEYGVGDENEEYGYFFTVLSPTAHTMSGGDYDKLNSDPTSQSARNNASSIVWLEYAGTSILFTSCAGNDALIRLIDSYKLLQDNYIVNLPSCNVVTLANHGAESSACVAFYDCVQPEAAVVSVGSNGYGCPSLDAISNAVNYTGQNNLYRTDELGAVTIEVTTQGYKIV